MAALSPGGQGFNLTLQRVTFVTCIGDFLRRR
jgi:hypothetical protein